MYIEKVKAEISWDIVPYFLKGVSACNNSASLGDLTKSVIEQLTKVVFPKEDLVLRSLHPQEDKSLTKQLSET